jgi:hypothetical protein
MAMSPDRRQNHDNFFLGLPGSFQQILALCRPVLEQVYKDEKHEPPPPDIFSLKLSGFGVKDPRENPIHWDVSFETNGDDYLGVLIRFMGESAMPARSGHLLIPNFGPTLHSMKKSLYARNLCGCTHRC